MFHLLRLFDDNFRTVFILSWLATAQSVCFITVIDRVRFNQKSMSNESVISLNL